MSSTPPPAPQSPDGWQSDPQNPYGQAQQPAGAQPGYGYGAPQDPGAQQAYGVPPAWTAPQAAFAGAGAEPPITEAWYGADLKQAVSRFVQKYAHFKGYASRGEYWWASLALVVVNMVFGFLIRLSGDSAFSTILSILSGLWGLAIVVPVLAMTWRRLHDAGYPGPFFFLVFIPFVGWIILLILLVMPTSINARRVEWADPDPTATINWTWK